jgi:tRNA1(Val) A37 N6-methylase TrmN6
LAKKLDFKEIYTIDISEKAIEVAKKNILCYKLEDKIKILNTDFKELDFILFK